MFRLRLFFLLLLHPFSLKRNNLRFISLRRLLAVTLVFPSYIILFLINRLALLLDELIFPGYRAMRIPRAAFIIGVPRSATTFIYHRLAADEQHFHAFMLWELLFAPAVCQKYFWLAISRIGRPLKGLLNWIDQAVFRDKRTVKIHRTGLLMHEEDEMLFLFNLSSVFFYFFFPEVDGLESLMYHDKDLSEKTRKANFRYYRSCVQRHNFVFDRNEQRCFLSKNPTFVYKWESVAAAFPEARFIYPLRSPFDTIPSTISLMAANYARFCRLPVRYPLAEDTRNLLIDWYIHAHDLLEGPVGTRSMTVLYPDIKANPDELLIQIRNFLCPFLNPADQLKNVSHIESKKHRSRHQYDPDVGIDKELIRQKLKGIVPIEWLS